MNELMVNLIQSSCVNVKIAGGRRLDLDSCLCFSLAFMKRLLFC